MIRGFQINWSLTVPTFSLAWSEDQVPSVRPKWFHSRFCQPGSWSQSLTMSVLPSRSLFINYFNRCPLLPPTTLFTGCKRNPFISGNILTPEHKLRKVPQTIHCLSRITQRHNFYDSKKCDDSDYSLFEKRVQHPALDDRVMWFVILLFGEKPDEVLTRLRHPLFDSWSMHNESGSSRRKSPNSTSDSSMSEPYWVRTNFKNHKRHTFFRHLDILLMSMWVMVEFLIL